VSKPRMPKPPCPVEFREQMIELMRAGRTPSEFAKEFGCHACSIHNCSDQGSQYTSIAFGKRCKEMSVRSCKNKTEARLAVFTWIEGWYNSRKHHSGLNYQSPNNFERDIQLTALNSENPII
jgi:transposase InsO family protein